MERHPIPQHIAGYEFRLIGDMTLKQFGELAAGVILAVISWYLPVMPLIKYPLVFLFTLLGIGLAFIPIQERPLDRWIINFFVAVYSPTQYLWQKAKLLPEFWQKEALPPPPPLAPIPPQDQKKLREYLATIPSPEIAPLEETEKEYLEKFASFFTEESVPKIPKFPKLLKQPARKTIKPKFEPALPMPSTPTIPNILVGMVLDEKGKILPDVIIEIRDEKGFPVRAFKANKLGQFRIATALKNGTYEIELEKEGYQFDIIKFKAQGEIIEPMEIKAKKGPAHAE